jgi:hypothetical protein
LSSNLHKQGKKKPAQWRAFESPGKIKLLVLGCVHELHEDGNHRADIGPYDDGPSDVEMNLDRHGMWDGSRFLSIHLASAVQKFSYLVLPLVLLTGEQDCPSLAY